MQRSHNERLVLSLVRRKRELSKAELARLTGLSPTAVGAIVRALEDAGLLRRGLPMKGRVGQPAAPFSLDPDGALALGLKIGRRSCELVLIDAEMRPRALEEWVHAYPDPDVILAVAGRAAEAMLRAAGRRERLVGLGVAMPSEIWCWADEMQAPPGALERWRGLDLAEAFGRRLATPVTVVNDATAACAAQLAVDPSIGGRGGVLDFVYFFVGWFIGGGVALDGRLYEGRRGGAGALGSIPVAGEGGAPAQLIRSASLYCLERAVAGRDGAREAMWRADADWRELGAPLDDWLETASVGVAQAIAAAAAVIDFDTAVIDGSFPPEVRARLVAGVAAAFERLDRQGLAPLGVAQGTVGRNARAIGAACVPLLAAFAVDETAMARRLEPVAPLALARGRAVR